MVFNMYSVSGVHVLYNTHAVRVKKLGKKATKQKRQQIRNLPVIWFICRNEKWTFNEIKRRKKTRHIVLCELKRAESKVAVFFSESIRIKPTF